VFCGGEAVRRIPTLLAWAIIGFLYLPLAVVVAFAFQGSSRLALPFDGPSVRWFATAATDRVVADALLASLRVGLIACTLAVPVAFLTAYALSRYRIRFRGAVSGSALLSVALPPLFLGLSLLTYLSSLGIGPSLDAVALAHAVYVLPYALLAMEARLEKLDPAVEEAARDLGAGPWQTFARVVLPAVWPVALGAGALGFALSFDEFPIALFLAGSDPTLPIAIWSRLRRVIDPSVNAIAATLVGVVGLGVVVGTSLVQIRTLLRGSERGPGA